jgi:hypothetical protein
MSQIGVGLLGYKGIGGAHSNTYRQVPHFFDVDPLCNGYASLLAAEGWLTSLKEVLSQSSLAAQRPTLYANDGSGVIG